MHKPNNDLYKRICEEINEDEVRHSLDVDDYNARMVKLDKLHITEIASWCIMHDIGHVVCVPENGQRCIYVTPSDNGYDIVINVSTETYAQVIDGIIGENIYKWPDGDWRNITDIQRVSYKKIS